MAGHGPFENGRPCFVGKRGRELRVEEGEGSAQLVALNGEERGRDARSAAGMAALPFGISVEIERIFEVG